LPFVQPSPTGIHCPGVFMPFGCLLELCERAPNAAFQTC
jgi:hypothetical protein